MKFTGIERPDEFQEITRAHIIAPRDDPKYWELSGATIRHRLAVLYHYLNICVNICATRILWPTIRSKASSGLQWKAMKAKRWRSGIIRTERLLQVQVPQKLINKPSKPQPRGIVDYGEDARSRARAPELQKADLA